MGVRIREKSPAVGESECPLKNCKDTATVHRYRETATDPKLRRFAGKLYCICPTHGRVENQEFLLERMKWYDGKKDASDASPPAPKAPAPPVKAPPVPPAKTPEKQAPAPVTPPASKSEAWLLDYFTK